MAKKVLITDVADAIKAGAGDEELNLVIEGYISDHGLALTVSQFRLARYEELRGWAYPPMADYLDAQVKIASGGSLALEGEDQLDAYYAACLAVKLRFPKI